MAAKDFIVAIELGSSKITGIAGKKNLDGSITVLAVVKEDSSSFIKKGVVYNVDKTEAALKNIIQRLTSQLKTEITQVYVGIGGQSIRSVMNTIPMNMVADTKVTDSMVADLMDANRNVVYPEREILDMVPLEYRVDQQYQTDPVGIPCKRFEGNFLNILVRKAFFLNLADCFKNAGINVAEFYQSPLVLAETVLTEAEKRAGCVLVDLGADTTTVSVYSKNLLRHLAVIPLGGANITKDIASLQIEESDAEKMKLKYACALTDNSAIDESLTYPIDSERSIASREFIEIVESRLMEIIENVWNQVPSEYSDKLLGGIILTGGGANMKEIEKAFTNHTHIDKIRIAKFVNFIVNSTNDEVNSHNAMMNTVLGLLAKGDENCAGGEAGDTPNIFGSEIQQPAAPAKPARKVGETEGGAVVKPDERDAQRQKEEAERLAQEEAERRAREEAEIKEQEEEEKRRRKEEKKRSEGGIFSSIKKGFGKFIGTLTEEEKDDESES